MSSRVLTIRWFQHTAARRRLVLLRRFGVLSQISFNTQPPEGGWATRVCGVASYFKFQHTAARRRLALSGGLVVQQGMFQHTAARRRLVLRRFGVLSQIRFQHTAARRRLVWSSFILVVAYLCFNTQPPEGGWLPYTALSAYFRVSTHSRPKAAGRRPNQLWR